MRFVLIDRITDGNSGKTPVALKNLSLAEEYLADHFPGFPVMPGVLMLGALTQAGAWLIREMEDFSHSIVVLKSAKTIKYGSFVEPGRLLTLNVDLTSHDENDAHFKGVGSVDGQTMVQGRFTLTRYNLRDKNPALYSADATLVAHLRELYSNLLKGSVGSKAMTRISPPQTQSAPA